MKNLVVLFLSIASLTFNPFPALSKEIKFQLEEHQKLVGTYSGDVDQETSVHLAIYNDKEANTYGIIPFFITKEGKVISLEKVTVTHEPSIISYHFNPQSSNLTLLVQNGKRKDQQLEIIDFSILGHSSSRNTLVDYKEPYLVIRTKEKTFLLFKEKENLEITTIIDSQKHHSEFFSFSGENAGLYNKIFETTPESINTNEYVEFGSISESKVYFFNERLIFDHSSEDKYTTLSLDPERNTSISLNEFHLEDVKKLKDINSFIYGSKAFLFLNNKEDINLRSYDLESGKLIFNVLLKEELSGYLDSEALEKIIRKSSRNSFSLTGTVNEGPENSMVVTIDYVSTRNYNYHYNWWWHHQFMHQQMMWNQQMMQQHIQMQMNTFGPNPESHATEDFTAKKTQSVQLRIDQDFKFHDGREATTLRPEIDKEKTIEIFKKNKQLKDVSLAFTQTSARAIFYSKTTNMVHIQKFDF